MAFSTTIKDVEEDNEVSFCFSDPDVEVLYTNIYDIPLEEEDTCSDVEFNVDMEAQGGDDGGEGGDEDDDEIVFNLEGDSLSDDPSSMLMMEGDIPLEMLMMITELDDTLVSKGNCIGTGLTAKVFIGSYDKRPAAIKVFNTKTDVRVIDNEIRILQRVDHPNIVKYHGCTGLLRSHSVDKQIIMEYYPRGSLFDLLHTAKTTRTRARNSSAGSIVPYRHALALGIAKGMTYLHNVIGIIHCDLSSKNVLVSNSWEPKIADFGLSKHGSSLFENTGFGTDLWRAPEICFTKRKAMFTNKIDVYSYGIILWELWHVGHLPYEGVLDAALEMKKGKRPRIAADCPVLWKTLMGRCWHMNPEERPTFSEIVLLLENYTTTTTTTTTTTNPPFTSVTPTVVRHKRV